MTDHDQAAAGIKEIENEVLIMSRLEHHNIVRLLGVTDGECMSSGGRSSVVGPGFLHAF